MPNSDAQVTLLYEVKYAQKDQVQNLVRNLMTKNADLQTPAGNLFILTDSGSNILRIMEVLDKIDIEGTSNKLNTVTLQYADAQGMAQKLNEIFGIGAGAEKAKPAATKVRAKATAKGESVEPPAGLPTVVEKDGEVTGLDFSDADKKPSKKLQVIPLIEGDGAPARDDSLVTFDYFGVVWGEDKPFDESFSKDPVTFPLGTNGLIKAWDQGLVGVKAGSRVMIVAPPEFGYGAAGSPQGGIKKNATLVFVVDILGVDG
jgi:FKBP-type peptidyl-prolyl cis-trans isomerase